MIQELRFGLYHIKWSAFWDAILGKFNLVDRCKFRQNGIAKLVHLTGLSIIELVKVGLVKAFE